LTVQLAEVLYKLTETVDKIVEKKITREYQRQDFPRKEKQRDTGKSELATVHSRD